MFDSSTPQLTTVLQALGCAFKADTCERIVLAWFPVACLREAEIQEMGRDDT